MKKVAGLAVLLLAVSILLFSYPVDPAFKCWLTLYADISMCESAQPDDQTCINAAMDKFRDCLRNIPINHPDSKVYGSQHLAVAAMRSDGPPVTDAYFLTVERSGEFYVNLVNGHDTDKKTRISSASVDIYPYGEVVRPSDLNKNVFLLTEPVYLEAGTYMLEVEVRGTPGSYLAIIVSDANWGELFSS